MSMVKPASLAFPALLLAALVSTGCLGPSGDSVDEKRASALAMREEALAVLYEDKPELKEKVERALGYGVFSNFSVHPGLLSFAGGYGVITNRTTGKDTHMKWWRLTIGPGIAVKGLYGLVILDDAERLEKLEEGRWVAGGQLEAGLVFGDFGGSFEKGWLFGKGVEAHYTTHTGVALEIELIGIAKVSNNRKLNSAAP